MITTVYVHVHVCVCMPYLYRLGKRTYIGMLNDGYNSLTRYLYNNFYDGFRQVRFLKKTL